MDAPASSEAVVLTPRSRSRSWQGLLLGVVCGSIVWAIMHAVHPVFAVPERFHIAGIGAPVAQHVAFRHQQDIVDRRHLTLYLGLLGLLLGGALGRLLGGCWPEKVLAATSAVNGAFLASMSASLFYVVLRDRVGQGDLLYPFLRQLMVGVPLGASLGLGLMMRTGSWRAMGRGLLGGAIGGVLFSAAYTLIVAIGLPEANTESLLPEETLTRLVWFTTLAGSIGLMASFPFVARQSKDATISGS